MKIHNQQLLESFYKKDKLNVAIVTDIFFPTFGGVSFVVDNLAKAIIAGGKANVAVFTGAVKGHVDNAPYPIIRVKSIPIPKAWGDSQPVPKLDRKLKKLLEKLDVDVVDVHSVWGVATFFMKYAKKKNLPIVYHGHGKFDSEYPTYVKFKPLCNCMVRRGYRVVNKADLIMPVSYNTQENYQRNGVVKPSFVLSNATDMKGAVDKNYAFNKVKELCGVDTEQENVFVLATRLEMECKNIAFLLDSLKIVKQANVNYKMIIMGGGRDKEKIEKYAKELGLEDRVILVGEIRDREVLKCFYRRADLHLFPSVKDTSSLAKLEAGTQFTPTIAIENTGPSEGVVDGDNGYLSPEISAKYAEKIMCAIADKEQLKKVSENAQKTFSKTWEDAANTCIEQYHNLIKSKN